MLNMLTLNVVTILYSIIWNTYLFTLQFCVDRTPFFCNTCLNYVDRGGGVLSVVTRTSYVDQRPSLVVITRISRVRSGYKLRTWYIFQLLAKVSMSVKCKGCPPGCQYKYCTCCVVCRNNSRIKNNCFK